MSDTQFNGLVDWITLYLGKLVEMFRNTLEWFQNLGLGKDAE